MKKTISLLLVFALVLVTALSLSACGESQPENQDSGLAGIANPWTETDAEGIRTALGVTFSEPEEGEAFVYRLHSAAGLAEMTITLDSGEEMTARMQATDGLEDISGMYYGWETTDSDVFSGKLEGREMRCTDSTGEAVVGLWYDDARGMTYCLSGVSESPLSLAIAENIFPVG